MGGCLDAVQIVLGLQHGLDRSNDNREIFGPAASHDTVNRQLFNRGDTLRRRNLTQFLVRLMSRGRDRGRNQFFGRRNNSQAVGPAALKEQLDRSVVIVNVNLLGCEPHLPSRLSSDVYTAWRDSVKGLHLPRNSSP